MTFRRVAFLFFDFDVKNFDRLSTASDFFWTLYTDLYFNRPPRCARKIENARSI